MPPGTVGLGLLPGRGGGGLAPGLGRDAGVGLGGGGRPAGDGRAGATGLFGLDGGADSGVRPISSSISLKESGKRCK